MQDEFGATEFPVNNTPENTRDKRGKDGKSKPLTFRAYQGEFGVKR